MFKENQWGYEFQDNEKIIFFGKKNTNLENLRALYPRFKFMQIKQTHSDICVPARDFEIVEADAQYSRNESEALLIRTADCLPIMVYNRSAQMVLAVHAGWKGVANQITLKSFSIFHLNDLIEVYIGPHILSSSFEVEENVKNEILSQANGDVASYFTMKDKKFYIDLQKIVINQIQSKYNHLKIFDLKLNTFESLEFNSFRFDKTPSRNLSFISLK